MFEFPTIKEFWEFFLFHASLCYQIYLCGFCVILLKNHTWSTEYVPPPWGKRHSHQPISLWLMSEKNKVNSRGSWETGQTGLINNFKPIDSAHYVTRFVMMNIVKASGCKLKLSEPLPSYLDIFTVFLVLNYKYIKITLKLDLFLKQITFPLFQSVLLNFDIVCLISSVLYRMSVVT